MTGSIVIAGGGQAGFQVAASLRQGGFAGRITMVEEQESAPYQRPPLSKAYLQGKLDADGLLFRKPAFYGENAIELLRDRAESIDRTNGRLLCRSGAALAFDHLVLCTGAHNRALPVPGAKLDGVYGLRTLADAHALRARLPGARSAVVIGAGFIGLEFAAVASAAGLAVHVIERADRPMARAVSPTTSGFFAAAHSGWGVGLDLQRELAAIRGEAGRVTGVELVDGTVLPADLIVVGIGILPNVALAAEAGLDIRNGIAVGSDLLTSDPAISAIGDCAAFPDPVTGGTVRLESVQNAIEQGRAVASRLLGSAAPYRAVPWFWSDQRDLKLQIAGLSDPGDEAVTIGQPANRSFSVLLFRQGRFAAAECVNRPADFMAARLLLARAATLTPEAARADGFELKRWEAAGRAG